MLEHFAQDIRNAVGGAAVHTRAWPYRDAEMTRWTLEVAGPIATIRLTFCESGETRLPTQVGVDSTGTLADPVDAHYFFGFIEREVTDGT